MNKLEKLERLAEDRDRKQLLLEFWIKELCLRIKQQ